MSYYYMKSIEKEETPQLTENKDELAAVKSQILFETFCLNEWRIQFSTFYKYFSGWLLTFTKVKGQGGSGMS